MHSRVDMAPPVQDNRSPATARITAIRVAPLQGQSPQGGWSNEIAEEDSIHALVAIHTDAGLSGAAEGGAP
jgi:hypothetical protein